MNVVSAKHMTNRFYTFNTTPEQLRRLGARGGRAYGRKLHLIEPRFTSLLRLFSTLDPRR
jgi:hypothetical protein